MANWIAFNQEAEWIGGNEFLLFTDAHIVGETMLGPYTFINTIATMNREPIKPGIILRYDCYKEWDHPIFKETDASLYHGGSPPEEIAALASLYYLSTHDHQASRRHLKAEVGSTVPSYFERTPFTFPRSRTHSKLSIRL